MNLIDDVKAGDVVTGELTRADGTIEAVTAVNESENIRATGTVVGTLVREDGTVEDIDVSNLVVDVGKTLIAARLGNNATYVTHMAVGTGNTAAAVGQTALVTETSTRVTVTATPGTKQIAFAATFTGIAATVAEIGLFSASTAGTMVARTLVGPFTLSAGDTLSFTWTITIN